jgi:peptidyl-prolyl cis-trans isomerase D
MLDIMRRKKRLKAILWLVIVSLGLGMLLLFVPNVGDSGALETSAATVDGEPISIREFAKAYGRMVDSYSSGGRNKTDPETLRALGLDRQALDALISVRVVEYAAKRLGLEVSADEVRRAVQSNPNFQDRGTFIGVDRYKALLAANRMGVTEFEDGMRSMLLAAKIRSIISDSMDVSERELRAEFARENVEAQVHYALLKKADFAGRVKPSESDLRAYFESHKDKYHIREERRAQYLLIDIAAISNSIEVSEREIENEWDRQERQETVDASHILFKVEDAAKDAEVKARAEAVLKQAKAGEDFAELAKKHSQDEESAPQGGNVGAFPRGRMASAFEDAAFSLKPGEISDLVRTEFGYHIIKVLRHDIPSLEENKPGVRRAVQLNKASELAKQKAVEAQKLAETEKDFAAIAKKVGVPLIVRETPFVSKNADLSANGLSQPLLDEIFRLKEVNAVGRSADHLTGYAIPKLLEIRLPKPPEFSESRAAVEKDYVDQKAAEILNAAAARVSQDAIASGDLEAAARKNGIASKQTAAFKRNAQPDPEIGTAPAFATAAFDLPIGSVSAPIALEPNAKIAVLQVKTRTPFDEEAYKNQKSDVRNRLLGMWQEAYFQEYIRRVTDSLEKSGKIRVNSRALDQVAGVRY